MADETTYPPCPGVAPGQTYGGALPAEAPPEGTVWVPVQRDDETAPAELSDGDAAALYAKAVGSPIPHGVWADDRTATPDDVYVAVPLAALNAPAPVVAVRVTMHEAKRHFEAGGAVLVSEYGHEPTQTVTAITTTHDRTRTTWDALAADVKEWRNRYPNQRFYIVPTVDACTCSTDEDACPDHPGDPCPACGRRSGHDDGCTDDDAAACEGFGNLIEMGTPDDETERDDIDVDTLDGMRCAAAMLASVVAAVRAEVAVRSAEFEEQHYGNADESLEAARCAGNLNALRWLESLVTAPIR